MLVSKIEINADHDARLDACLEQIVDIIRDGAVDANTLGSIMAVRHDLPKTEAMEMVQRAQAVRQQQ
jgi:hypothetical protein